MNLSSDKRSVGGDDCASIWPANSDSRCQSTAAPTRQEKPRKKNSVTLREEHLAARGSRLLCEHRVRLAAASRMAGPGEVKYPSGSEEQRVLDAFPPRRHWRKHRPRIRREMTNEEKQIETLQRAVQVESRRPSEEQAEWYRQHQNLVAMIVARILSEDPFQFDTFHQIAIRKSQCEFRVTTRLGIFESIIARCVAEWLRSSIDCYMSPHSFAFREPKGGVPVDHNTAFGQLRNFHATHGPIFVAETDIRGFFDTVPHHTIISSLKLMQRRLWRDGDKLDPRGLRIVLGTLESYDFQRCVLDRSSEILGKRVGQIPWPAGELRKLHMGFETCRFGIPQGLSFSPILSNVVLDYADRCVRAVILKLDHPVLYLRFCDDTLIASPDQKSCLIAWEAYNVALRKLGLPVHQPSQPTPYGQRPKSRAPYLLGPTVGGTSLVEFLGYTLGWDGVVGIRRSTIDKQIARIDEVADQAFQALRTTNKDDFFGAMALFTRLQRRLAACAAGRGALHRHGHRFQGWGAAFPHLADSPERISILRELDRYRHTILRNFRRVAERHLDRKLSIRRIGFFGRCLKFFGAPFSYNVRN